MNERFPDATAEELARDSTCIVCREVTNHLVHQHFIFWKPLFFFLRVVDVASASAAGGGCGVPNII